MNKRALLITLLLGLSTMSAYALAEEIRKHDAPAEQSVSEPAAGILWIEPDTGMEFVWVPTGCFQMGSETQAREQPVHKVCVPGFWMGRYEVTQSQYQQVMGRNPSKFPGPNNPVDQATWYDAANFTEEMGYRTGTKVRLPSEAEWEYACRAGGAHDKFCGPGDLPNRMAWNEGNSGSKVTHPVGQLAANAWGLYDMSGNVLEWTQDCWNDNYNGAPADGSPWKTGDCSYRAYRGGSHDDSTRELRAAYRHRGRMGGSGNSCQGFRVVRTQP